MSSSGIETAYRISNDLYNLRIQRLETIIFEISDVITTAIEDHFQETVLEQQKYPDFDEQKFYDKEQILDNELGLVGSYSTFGENRFIEMVSLCHSLTSMKLYSKLESSTSKDTKDKFELVNQSKLITKFIKFIDEKVDFLIERSIDLYIDPIEDVSSQELSMFWQPIIKTFRSIIRSTLPVFQYVKINYPRYAKNIPNNLTVPQYLEKRLIIYLEENIGSQRMEFFIGDYWIYLWTKKKIKFEKKLKLSLINCLYNINYTLQDSSSKSVDEIMSERLQKYLIEDFKLPVNENYLQSVKKYFQRNSYLCMSVSLDLVVKMNDVMVENTIMNPTVFRQYFKSLCDSLKVNEEKSIHLHNERDTQLNLLDVRRAFKSRHKMPLFNDLLVSNISSYLNEGHSKYMRTKDPFYFLQSIILLFIITRLFNDVDKMIFNNVHSIMGGTIKFYEFIVRLFDVSIKKIMTNSLSASDYSDNLFLIDYLLRYIPLELTILKIHASFIFRKLIIEGPEKVEMMFKLPFMHSIWKALEAQFKTTPEYQEYNSLLQTIQHTTNISLAYNSNNMDIDSELLTSISPLFLEKLKVPVSLYSQDDENPILPASLDEQISGLESYFRSSNKHDTQIEVKQAYHLHSCEVTSPFILGNGNHLIFQLNLFQTCVLNLFNDYYTLSYDTIAKKTNLSSESLDPTLTSFLQIGLLKKDRTNNFSINKKFHPDKKRIKNGKLRISVAPSRKQQYTNLSSAGTENREGNVSMWQQELLKACITREVKASGNGLNMEVLQEKVSTSIQGFSVGEFKDALNKVVSDGIILQKNVNFYF
ncbi:hypothetical protein TBLA_0F03430 [Henningerozyma blattae CBS 6284]|uniref:Cullin family profile domain-containing protein n=1 Tax=Henningerozyma blattae (strain ATCC 34711 / CBS 6284 / DSM 70876 / NBRC 10599 / NRRL Y-10934 / UCD 77-7) TaxID=1071380 RepID=I2H678_HENB6|nr:hypothetical protein TBLA_0F03430 [Tetrapisispora blattae CBS 6284]CCH61880.1 hypothetical protein TBLA_0F03430 [Tetrapisispora blattae CBS 6284]